MIKRRASTLLAVVVMAVATLGLTSCDIPADGSLHEFTIASAGKTATFTISGAVGRRVSVQIPNAGSLCESATFQTIKVTLSKPDGSIAASGYGCSALAIDHHRMTVAGTYRVTIDPTGSQTGSANLVVFTNLDTTVAATPNALQAIAIATPGQTATITVPGAVGKRISVQLPNAGTMCDNATFQQVAVTLYKPDGTQAVAGYGCGPLAIDHYRLTTTGSYRVVIDPGKDLTGEANAVVYTNADTTTTVAANTLQPYTIATPGQLASFTLPGTAGQYLSIRVPNAGTLCGSTTFLNVSVTLLKPDGTEAASGHGCREMAIDHVRLPSAGTYTVVIDPAKDVVGSGTAATYTNVDTMSPAVSGVASAFTIATPGQLASLTIPGTSGQHLSVVVPNAGTICAPGTYQAVLVTLLKPDGTKATSSSGCNALAIDTYPLTTSGTYTVTLDAADDRTGAGQATITVS